MAQRIIWIDLAKAFGIFLVVVGHVTGFAHAWIYSFHMPLFFFLSGTCLSNKRGYTEFCLKRIKSLILPYFYFGIIITLLCLYLDSIDVVWNNLSSRFFNYGAMWFIPVLFVTEILFYPISKFRNKYLIVSILIFSAIIGWMLSYYSIVIPLSLSTCFAALFFYGLGFLSKELIDRLFSKTYLLLIFVSVHLLLLLLSDTVIGMSNNVISQPIYNFSVAIAGLLSFCMLFYLCKDIKIKGINQIIGAGQNTLIILCFHMLFIGYAGKLIKPHINNQILYKGIEFIFIWLLCFIMIFVINRYFPWMVNRQKIK